MIITSKFIQKKWKVSFVKDGQNILLDIFCNHDLNVTCKVDMSAVVRR